LSRVRIEIANPLPGGSRWTSLTRAEGFVRRGLAMMRDEVLVFYGPDSEFYSRLDAIEFERAVVEGRGDRVYWNGRQAKHQATHLPGEVVS
jgi:hypothetical protein